MDDYDLRQQPWIPVLRAGGTIGTVGLRELFGDAASLSGINAPMPPGYAALWHVLTALTYRITRLDTQSDVHEWRRRRDRWLEHGTFDSVPPALRDTWPDDPCGNPVEQYLSRFDGRFSLFGDRPFLQDTRLRDECVTKGKGGPAPDTCGVNKFVLGRPTGVNGATWWTRHHDGDQRPIPPSEAVWWLLTQWYYGAAGKITARDVGGKKTSDSKAGMLRGTVSYYPSGDRLFDSLMVSLVPPAHALPEDTSEAGPDLCPWEWEEPPRADALPQPPGGICSRLTSVHRHAFLLVRDADGNVGDVYRTWAYRAPVWPEIPATDPFLAYRVDGDSPRPRRADPARALWRDLDGLLPEAHVTAVRGTGPGRAVYRRPAFLDDFAEIGVRKGIVAVGFHQDPKTVDHEWWLSRSPQVLMECFDTSGPEERQTEIALAAVRILDRLERASRTLKGCLARAWSEGTRGASDSKLAGVWPAQGVPMFWEKAERFFQDRLRAEINVLSGAEDTGGDGAPSGEGDGSRSPQEVAVKEAEAETERRMRALVRSVYDEVTAVAVAKDPGEVDPHLQLAVIEHRPYSFSGRPTGGGNHR